MLPEDVRAVVFDMDGLMYDTERLVSLCWKDVAARHGIDIPDSLVERALGLTCADTETLFQKHFDEMGARADAAALRGECNDLLLERVEAEGSPAKPGLYALLERIRERGLYAAVASSSYPGRVETLLRKSGLADAFDVVVNGADVRRGKPDPEIFLAAAARLGLASHECLALEDSRNGALAAHAAGMPVIIVPDMVAPADDVRKLAVAVLPSLDEVIPLI